MDEDSTNEIAEQHSTADEQATSEDQTASGQVVVTPPASHDNSITDGVARSGTLLARRQANNPESPEIQSVSGAIDVPGRSVENGTTLEPSRTRTPDAERVINGEGPLTPRNDAGPFILDGGAGRASGRRVVAIPEVTTSDA